MVGIYKITSPSKKIYIGQSINIMTRWKGYRKLRCKSQRYLYHSLKKYGVDKHKFEIINKCLPEQLNELEKYYVDLYQTFNSKFGLNLRDGGGNRGMLLEETKQKIRLSLTGRKRPEYIGKLISEKLRGKKLSEETKLKISANHSRCNQGVTFSKETKLKISANNRMKRKLIDTMSNKNYNSILEASIDLNINYCKLRRMICGINKNKTSLIYM